MPKFDGTGSHDQVKLFFDLLEVLYTDDNPSNVYMDTNLKQLSLSEKQSVIKFFEVIIDQPAYMTNDHRRVRSALIDWYSTNKSMINRSKNASDVFGLSSESLNELIMSFGFAYPHKITSNYNKALFLLELVNLYNKKGTPITLARALQFFGLTNITLSEWWIEREASGLFVAKSQPIVPTSARETTTRKSMGYSEFTSDDPFWQLTYDQLETSYEDSAISLPSLTPHISLEADIDLNQLYPVLAIISKKMQESYDYWMNTGTLIQNIYIPRYGLSVSFLELTLAIGYVFDGLLDSSDKNIFQFQQTLDINNNSIYDYGDYPYEEVINEFNTLHARPKTKTAQDNSRATFNERFKGKADDFVIQDPRDPSDPTDAGDMGRILEMVNPNFKDVIDADTDEALESILISFDGYMSDTLNLTNFSFAFFIEGSSLYKRLKPIIDFFKPLRSRIREFLTSFLIKDPLGDSQLEEDYVKSFIYQNIYDFLVYNQTTPVYHPIKCSSTLSIYPDLGYAALYPTKPASELHFYPWGPISGWPLDSVMAGLDPNYCTWGTYAGLRPDNLSLDDNVFTQLYHRMMSEHQADDYIFTHAVQYLHDTQNTSDLNVTLLDQLIVEQSPWLATHGMDLGLARDVCNIAFPIKLESAPLILDDYVFSSINNLFHLKTSLRDSMINPDINQVLESEVASFDDEMKIVIEHACADAGSHFDSISVRDTVDLEVIDLEEF